MKGGLLITQMSCRKSVHRMLLLNDELRSLRLHCGCLRNLAVNAVGVNECSFPRRVTGVAARSGPSRKLEGFCGTIPSVTGTEDAKGVSSAEVYRAQGPLLITWQSISITIVRAHTKCLFVEIVKGPSHWWGGPHLEEPTCCSVIRVTAREFMTQLR